MPPSGKQKPAGIFLDVHIVIGYVVFLKENPASVLYNEHYQIGGIQLMNRTENIEKRKRRWNWLYEKSGEKKVLFQLELNNYYPERPPLWQSKKQERIDWILKKYELQLKLIEELEDDQIPYVDMLTGTEIFPECFGSKIVFPQDSQPFALPCVSNAVDAVKIKKPKLEDTPLMYLIEMGCELRKCLGKEAVFKTTDIQCPMDIVAMLWDKSDFFIALIEDSEAVKYLAGIVYELLTEFYDVWFSEFGKELVAEFPDYYMPKGIGVSVDEIGVINPEMFTEYFTPELEKLSKHYGGIGIHCCAGARHQWDNFSKIPGLQLINLVQPPEIINEAFRYYSDCCAQMHFFSEGGHAWRWPDELPEGVRTVMQIGAETMDEAKAIAEKMNRLLGRA